MSQEKVLVFATNKIKEIFGEVKGFKLAEGKDVEAFFETLPGVLSFRDRAEAENNPEFVQVIPYCVLVRSLGESIFVYERGKSGGENRLHAKLSLGVGGHINPVDGEEGKNDFSNTYENGLKRELAEEVGLTGEFTDELVGFIYDDNNEVGRVHFGVVHLINVPEFWRPSNVENSLTGWSFSWSSDIFSLRDRFETWSQLVIKNLMEKA